MFTIVIIEKSVRGETWLDEAGAKKRLFKKRQKNVQKNGQKTDKAGVKLFLRKKKNGHSLKKRTRLQPPQIYLRQVQKLQDKTLGKKNIHDT